MVLYGVDIGAALGWFVGIVVLPMLWRPVIRPAVRRLYALAHRYAVEVAVGVGIAAVGYLLAYTLLTR